MRLGVLFSGGKDSCYACYRAREREEVICLITVKPGNPESYMFHTPNIHWTRLQADAAGLPLVEVESSGEEEKELADLVQAIETARSEYRIEGVVTGAILSVYQATRIQRICRNLDLWCFNPLWHTDQTEYMARLICKGFHVIVSGVFSAPFDESWLGRELNRKTIKELQKYSRTYRITLTGEGGEYETFVLDAPFFGKKIVIERATKEYHQYRGRYEIQSARLVDK
ncbi:MAG: diphthine--ammonia ligase [Methanomicrobiales archaeon]|nr:diphthine--ammonia ligase [Methanomicrobiales archaeon]